MDGGDRHGRHDDAPPRAPRQASSRLEEEGGGDYELRNSWPGFKLSPFDFLALLIKVKGELFPLFVASVSSSVKWGSKCPCLTVIQIQHLPQHFSIVPLIGFMIKFSISYT